MPPVSPIVGTPQALHLRSTNSPKASSPTESAKQEALETPAVTRQEAQKGDRVAQRKLARQAAAAAGDAAGAKPATQSEDKAKTDTSAPGSLNVFA